MNRLFAGLVSVALIATACPRARTTGSPSPTGSPRPPSVTILGQNIRVLADSQRAVRIGFVAAEPTVRVIVTFPDTGSIVAACALPSFDSPIAAPAGSGCRAEIPSGVREELSSSSAIGAVAIWVRAGRAVDAAIRIEYAQGARPRPVSFGFPLVPAPLDPSKCKDNACNPLIEILPVRRGQFTADATWGGGTARLALLQGRLLAKSFTATGVPYSIPAEDRDDARAHLEARLAAPAEYALVFDENRSDITDIVIASSWP